VIHGLTGTHTSLAFLPIFRTSLTLISIHTEHKRSVTRHNATRYATEIAWDATVCTAVKFTFRSSVTTTVQAENGDTLLLQNVGIHLADYWLPQLNAQCRILLETLKVPKIFKKFPSFSVTRKYSTILKRARHLSLSRAR